MFKQKRKIIFLFICCIPCLLNSEIKYRVSGKLVYNGRGESNLKVLCKNINTNTIIESYSNSYGDYYFYLANGAYHILMSHNKKYVSREILKIITVDNKNISNVIFFLEDGCKISGYVRFNNGSPIENSLITVSSKRGVVLGETDNAGNYIIDGIRASEGTKLFATIPGVGTQEIELNLHSEGLFLQNINFLIPKNLTIKGRIIDKENGEPVKDVLISVYGEDEKLKQTTSDENGDFCFYNFKDGWYVFIFLKPKYYRVIKEFKYSEGNLIEISIEFEKLSDEDIEKGNYFGIEMD